MIFILMLLIGGLITEGKASDDRELKKYKLSQRFNPDQKSTASGLNSKKTSWTHRLNPDQKSFEHNHLNIFNVLSSLSMSDSPKIPNKQQIEDRKELSSDKKDKKFSDNPRKPRNKQPKDRQIFFRNKNGEIFFYREKSVPDTEKFHFNKNGKAFFYQVKKGSH